MEEAKVFEACFSLADDLMWESEQARIERLPEQMAELSEMTNEFVRIAKQCYYQIEDIPDFEAILLGAIKYLNAQAIPPLRGNYSWFFNSLSALLELCNPNSAVGKDGLPFLLALQCGVNKCIDWAREDREEFE